MSVLVCSPAIAGLIPSAPSSTDTASRIRGEEIGKIQRALENKILAEKLKAYGLSTAEVQDKLQSMTDEQVHMLSQASERLLAGGDGLGVIIALLVIVLLVIVILKLLHKEIIIK
jgi:hypothetical protein